MLMGKFYSVNKFSMSTCKRFWLTCEEDLKLLLSSIDLTEIVWDNGSHDT
jgi:hypothetical protein